MDETTPWQGLTTISQLSTEDADVVQLLASQMGDSPEAIIHQALQAYAKKHLSGWAL